MKIITMIMLAMFWGFVSGQISVPPISFIIAFIGGGLIGWAYPIFYDKIFNK